MGDELVPKEDEVVQHYLPFKRRAEQMFVENVVLTAQGFVEEDGEFTFDEVMNNMNFYRGCVTPFAKAVMQHPRCDIKHYSKISMFDWIMQRIYYGMRGGAPTCVTEETQAAIRSMCRNYEVELDWAEVMGGM